MDEIMKIEKETFREPWNEASFIQRHIVEPNLFVVAEKHMQIVAYIVGSVELIRQPLGHVMNLAVKKCMRRRGIGSMLLDRLEDLFRERKVQTAYLEVRKSNKEAIRMYQKRGFKAVRNLPRYYPNEDGLLMTKHIS
jgi:ribosomal-protein-alanine N-acetyltransferase